MQPILVEFFCCFKYLKLMLCEIFMALFVRRIFFHFSGILEQAIKYFIDVFSSGVFILRYTLILSHNKISSESQ